MKRYRIIIVKQFNSINLLTAKITFRTEAKVKNLLYEQEENINDKLFMCVCVGVNLMILLNVDNNPMMRKCFNPFRMFDLFCFNFFLCYTFFTIQYNKQKTPIDVQFRDK